eukprot:TRINITY_DN3483_c0_g1_i1.p1 TRINITY_DN3483_c0_g1~~TRINITY_DN3483_c0_g1_i1.p1  ORF type:complete len:546 (-),score=147.07 TRINITY_DN3483_c0_g1_i1:30-1667(-)
MMNDSEWDDADWVEEGPPCPGLFEPSKVFPSAEECWRDAKDRKFDILKIRKEWKLNTYNYVKLVNFLRTQTKKEGYTVEGAADLIQSVLTGDRAIWQDDAFLQPVLADDPLLCTNTYEKESEIGESDDSDWSSDDDEIPVEENAEVLQKKLKAALKELKTTKMALEEASSIVNKLRKVNLSLLDDSEPTKKNSGSSSSSETDAVVAREVPAATKEQFMSYEKGYFGAYAHWGIHDTMLKDTTRTDGYRDAIIQNPNLFKDKIVMDVGCGTGILSFFAVAAGAKKVIAVDNSDIIFAAMQNAKDNGLEDKIIFIRSKVELVELPQGIDHVDIIISEWMGYCLFFECMLPSVLVARDKFCLPNTQTNHVFPDKARLYLSAFEHESFYQNKIKCWENVYGYSMNTLKKAVLKEPHVLTLPESARLSEAVITKEVDMNDVSIVDLDFLTEFKMTIDSDFTVHGFVAYFDVGFERDCTNVVVIPTGPKTTSTHWEQTVFCLEEPLKLVAGDVIVGTFGTRRGIESHRDLAITLNIEVAGKYKKDHHFNLV